MSAGVVESRSPHQPEDLVVQTGVTTAGGVRSAVEAARAEQKAWAARPAAERSAALSASADAVAAAADELTGLVVREVGKPVTEARGEVARSVAILRYYAQQVYDPVGAMHEPSARGLLFTRRRPHGVAGLITPWNFPLAIPLWKAAPALAFGNTVVLKPAPEATATALRLAELMRPALGSDHVLRVVPGYAEEGTALVECADVISFTGSVPAGTAVSRAAASRTETGHGIPVQAEMGGLNASIVLPDADVAAAAAQMAGAAMGYAGQKCTATQRVIVVGDAAALRDALVAAVEALAVGDPAQDATVVGPVISEAARSRVLNATQTATRAGGRVLTGGQGAEDDGWSVQPTVVEGVAADGQLACEEVFGPICVIQSVGTAAEAVALTNSVRYGLVTSVYTRDLDAVLELVETIDTGLVKVNSPTSGVDFYLPFGGEKASSLGGREQGKAAQEFYTTTRTVTVAPASP